MFNILICDDEPITCSYIDDVISNYGKKYEINIMTETFYSGKALIQYMKKHSNADLLFLDIKLPDVDGDEIGEVLRDEMENEIVQIVFISSKEKYAMRLFKIRPFDFLIKPIKEDTIVAILEKYRKLYMNKTCFFEYKSGRQTDKILLKEVMYFMCEQRKICIVTRRDKIYFYGNMKELHRTLNADGFWSVHNSFIINIRYVKLFSEKEIIMCNDDIIPISKAYKKDLKQKLLQLNEVE